MCLYGDDPYTPSAYLCCNGLGDGYDNPFGYESSKSQICTSSYLNQLAVCRVVRPQRPKALATWNVMITPPPAARSTAHNSELRSAPARKAAMGLPAASYEVPITKGIALRAPQAASFGRIVTTFQASTMTRANPGVIGGHHDPSSRTF